MTQKQFCLLFDVVPAWDFPVEVVNTEENIRLGVEFRGQLKIQAHAYEGRYNILKGFMPEGRGSINLFP